MKKNLTFRYAAHQVIYWAGLGGIASFAVSYLTQRGFSAAQVGWVLFGAYIFSFLLQPLVASRVDKVTGCVIPGILFALTCLSAIALAAARFLNPPLLVFAILYMASILLMDMQLPLINSLCVLYDQMGVKINYGFARGMGGFGYAVATLGYGYLIEYAGAEWMPIASMAFIIISGILCITYPGKPSKPGLRGNVEAGQPATLFQFFSRYKWYCLSLLGVLLLASFHVMVENYLIEIFKRIGGDNSNVGTALFIATVTELPSMTVFPFIHRKIGTKNVLYISGISFTVKAVLLIISGSVTAIYLAQLLQCVSYVFLATVQVFYAGESTDPADMVKGQSLITASYTLGCAVGNLAGGIIISSNGAAAMLYSALGIAAAGLTVFVITLPKALPKKAAVKQ